MVNVFQNTSNENMKQEKNKMVTFDIIWLSTLGADFEADKNELF